MKARTDVRERKAKVLEGFERCDAILAYRTKAFKKTTEHAAQNHDSLKKVHRRTALYALYEPAQTDRHRRC